MMLRSKTINTENVLQNDSRHKRKQNEQIGNMKNPMEPVPKKQTSKGLTELRAHISGFSIDSAKRQNVVIRNDKEDCENMGVIPIGKSSLGTENSEENIQLLSDPSDPCPHFDFDKEETSLESVSEYARDVFAYYKSREKVFQVPDYMPNHPDLDIKTRAILVDWLVEMQESFELNHETLYNSVKLVDMYLAKTSNVTKEKIQVLACASVFIASKFDERSPPLADDLVYLSGDRFSRNDLMATERELLSTIGFDIGGPLSYRYLRRLGRVCRVDLATLTLARYILESSLLIYDYSLVSGSRMASAAFILAMKMKDASYEWNPVLEKYSGYTGEDIVPLMEHLNHTLHFLNRRWKQLNNIREKYSHEIFFESALVPLIPDVHQESNELIKLPEMQFP